VSLAEWPPALRGLIIAAEVECPDGHAATLRALTALASHKFPSRGLFDPGVRGDDSLFSAIDSVAVAHLGLGEARGQWRAALEASRLELEPRDRIEGAALQVQTISDTSYYYAGLAFGLVSVHLYR
jgi:hypothetical protein